MTISTVLQSRPAVVNKEYGRILSAAIVSSQFRQLLLTNPEKALLMGFGGETFQLAQDERKRLSSIQANSLAEFANQMNHIHELPAAKGYIGD